MAISFGRTGKNTATSGTIVSTITINPGETVVVAISVRAAGTISVGGVVDSSGTNIYSQLDAATSGNATQSFLWGVANVGSAASSVTVTISGTYTRAVVVVGAYIGLGTDGFGPTNTNTGSGTTPSVTRSTIDNDDWVVGGLAQSAGQIITFTANSGNLRDQMQSSAGFNNVCMVDNTRPTPGSVTLSATSDRSNLWTAIAVVLRPTGTAAFSSQWGDMTHPWLGGEIY